MRTLITGGAGCIGSDLAEALVRRGDDVVVVDNLSSGKKEHVAPLAGHANFRFVEGDLENAALVEALMGGVEIVYHLAGNPDVKYSTGDPTDRDLKQNTLCTYNVLEAARRRGVGKLVFASSAAVYGVAPKLPIAEDAFFPRPISLYGATKLACESMLSAFQHLFNLECWIFRFANIVGPKTRKTGGTVIGDFIMRLREDPHRLRILGDGQQARSYLLSAECVEAMLYAVDHARGGLQVFNIGCDDAVTVTEIADLVVSRLGLREVQYEFTGGESGWPGDVPRFLLDVGAINRLGWTARLTSRQAVESAIAGALQSHAEYLV
jgi:UDP-glucose 4-epimerase